MKKIPKNRYDLIFRLLNQAGHVKHTKAGSNNDLWYNWFQCIAAGVYLECLFKKEVEEAGKQVYKHVGKLGNGLWGDNNYFEWCEKTYDPNHPLRFSIETLDNIESIRIYLNNKSKEKGFHVSLFNLLEIVKPWELGKFKEI